MNFARMLTPFVLRFFFVASNPLLLKVCRLTSKAESLAGDFLLVLESPEQEQNAKMPTVSYSFLNQICNFPSCLSSLYKCSKHQVGV